MGERDMHSAYKYADGKKIDGKRVLVDVERGRTVKGWRPRRLGGGLGNSRRAASAMLEMKNVTRREKELNCSIALRGRRKMKKNDQEDRDHVIGNEDDGTRKLMSKQIQASKRTTTLQQTAALTSRPKRWMINLIIQCQS